MKRALFFALFIAILASGTSLAQANKDSAVRQEIVPAPLRSAFADLHAGLNDKGGKPILYKDAVMK
jgi:hypothetical protein